MYLSQTKVMNYVVNWLKKRGWKIIYAHYPEGHHISPEYGELKIIKRKFIDIVAKKGKYLLLIQCNRRFKMKYFEKLKKITKEDIKGVEFEFLLKGVAFNVIPSVKNRLRVVSEGGLVLEVKGENKIKVYGKIPLVCEGETNE